MAIQVAQTDQIKNDLEEIYQPLIGKPIRATYQGECTMPFLGTPRDVLVLEANNPFAATLKEISAAVRNKYGARVWKGITGPEDSPGYTDYWLWVESSPALQVRGITYNFKIERCAVFPGSSDGGFSYGVSTKVAVLTGTGY